MRTASGDGTGVLVEKFFEKLETFTVKEGEAFASQSFLLL